MAFFTGRSGAVYFEGKRVAKVRDWSIESTVELLSTNTIDSGVNTFVPGTKGATGSATLMYYRFQTGDGFNGTDDTEFSAFLGRVIKKGDIDTSNRVELELVPGGQTFENIKVNAYITSASISVSTGELTVVPINFTVDGDYLTVPLDITNPSA